MSKISSTERAESVYFVYLVYLQNPLPEFSFGAISCCQLTVFSQHYTFLSSEGNNLALQGCF